MSDKSNEENIQAAGKIVKPKTKKQKFSFKEVRKDMTKEDKQTADLFDLCLDDESNFAAVPPVRDHNDIEFVKMDSRGKSKPSSTKFEDNNPYEKKHITHHF